VRWLIFYLKNKRSNKQKKSQPKTLELSSDKENMGEGLKSSKTTKEW